MNFSPLFIFGQPRSGSTMLQRILNTHPKVLLTGEHLGILDGIATSFFRLANDRESNDFLHRDSQTLETLRNPNYFIAKLSGLSRQYMEDQYREFLARLCNPMAFQGRWGIKEIRYLSSNCLVVDFILKMFPQAKFLFTVRDPVTQIQSVLSAKWWHLSYEAAVDQWLEQYQAALAYKDIYPENIMIISYEKFLEAPQPVLDSMKLLTQLEFVEGATTVINESFKVGATPNIQSLTQKQIREICQKCRYAT